MNWFRKLFHKNEEIKEARPLPSWDETVELMYDKQLNLVHPAVRVIYSEDKERRYVITQNEDGLLVYQLQRLYSFDEDEWQRIGEDEGALPGYWSLDPGTSARSVFNSFDDLMNDLRSQPEYKSYFNDHV